MHTAVFWDGVVNQRKMFMYIKHFPFLMSHFMVFIQHVFSICIGHSFSAIGLPTVEQLSPSYLCLCKYGSLGKNLEMLKHTFCFIFCTISKKAERLFAFPDLI